MNFFSYYIDPIKNHYFDFSGRAGRSEYWMFFLVYLLVAVVISIIEVAIGVPYLLLVYTLALLLPYFGLGARRLHDVGLSGWWQLLNVIPIIGTLILIVLFARPGQAAANQHGTNLHQ